ncbi:MAG: C25 family peptidase propeptide domain-containing protein, partial [Anaerolineales bacterium]
MLASHFIQFKKALLLLLVISTGVSSVLLFTHGARAGFLFHPRAETKTPEIEVTETGSSYAILTFELPEFSVEDANQGGLTCQKINLDLGVDSQNPGWPMLPVKGAMIGIPQTAEPVLEIIETQVAEADGVYNICPAPEWGFEFQPGGKPGYRVNPGYRDHQAYSSDRFSTRDPVKIADTGYIRDQKFAELQFQPFQYNPVSGQLRYYAKIVVRVDFSSAEAVQSAGGAFKTEGSDPFEGIMESLLLNYKQAQEFSAGVYKAIPGAASVNASSPYPVKISVDKNGIYKVPFSGLDSIGFDTGSIDPATYQLFNMGNEVAIFVGADHLLFYGEKMDSRYTGTNAYWLTWGESNGLRMENIGESPTGAADPTEFWATVHLEQNHLYGSAFPNGPDQDR